MGASQSARAPAMRAWIGSASSQCPVRCSSVARQELEGLGVLRARELRVEHVEGVAQHQVVRGRALVLGHRVEEELLRPFEIPDRIAERDLLPGGDVVHARLALVGVEVGRSERGEGQAEVEHRRLQAA